MSSSGLIAAKKRIETSVRKYPIPTIKDDKQTTESSECKNGVLLLSLLQSRINWANFVFNKYRPDPVQQPKRNPSIRKKWPNMKYLGTCTLQLGPHLFEQTCFYEAVRSETWESIAKAQNLWKGEDTKDEGIAEIQETLSQDESMQNSPPPSQSTEEDEQQQSQQHINQADQTPKEHENRSHSPQTNASASLDMDMDQTPSAEKPERLVFKDIVFELKEVSNERFIFPKNSIIESIPHEQTNQLCTVLVSFILPVETLDSYDFFLPTKDKILKYGNNAPLSCVQDFINSEGLQDPTVVIPCKEDTYQPVNIRLTDANIDIVNALNDTVLNADHVVQEMKEKMKYFPEKSYIDFNLPADSPHVKDIQELLRKAATVPDVSIGPVQAEKKRNEILNAIKLGKRPRDEKFEAELPKTKNANIRDDAHMKCAYCSTKTTAMWRRGPNGHGTLCNSCGLLWRRGEILKGAPVISEVEEWKLFYEKKEREKAVEALELEKMQREAVKKQQQQQQQQQQHQKTKKDKPTGSSDNQNQHRNERRSLVSLPGSLGHFASQLLEQKQQQQRQQQTRQQETLQQHQTTAYGGSESVDIRNRTQPSQLTLSTPSHSSQSKKTMETHEGVDISSGAKSQHTAPSFSTSTASPTPPAAGTACRTANVPTPIKPKINNPANPGAQPPAYQQCTQQNHQQQACHEAAQLQPQQHPLVPTTPVSLYNMAGIPLPTLSIRLGQAMHFFHPHCGLTLMDKALSIRLLKEGYEPFTFEMEKEAIIDATFEVVTEAEENGMQNKREVLRMKAVPKSETATVMSIFGQPVFLTAENGGIQVRFLEKLDPNGGAVVQRIIQRWLANAPQT